MNDNIQYIAANSGVIHHKGFTILDVAIGQWKTKQKAIVMDHLTADILFGTDWLSQHGVIINYEKKLLSCGQFFSNLTTTKIQTSHCIFTTRAITIPPLSSHIEWFNVPESFNGLSYFENENPVRYLDIRDGLFDINQNAVPVVLVNKHNFEVMVGKGKFIGKLEQLEKDSYSLDFKKKWNRARERIQFVNDARKKKFRQLYKKKIIEIGDSVRLDAPATKLGIKAKIRGDLWSGPFKVIGKLPNGNLKLNINKSKSYIVHPDRVKPAEILFQNWPEDIKKIKPAKSVSFSDNLIDIIAELHPLEQKKILLPKHVHFSI
jgi:hypothetical protein